MAVQQNFCTLGEFLSWQALKPIESPPTQVPPESASLICSYLGFRKLCLFQLRPTKRTPTRPPSQIRMVREYTPWVGKRDAGAKYSPWKGKRSTTKRDYAPWIGKRSDSGYAPWTGKRNADQGSDSLHLKAIMKSIKNILMNILSKGYNK